MSKEAIVQSALYLVATPIGNLAEITARAKWVLAKVDLVLCEDTRRANILLKSLGISAKLRSFHQHNSKLQTPKILAELAEAKSIALISDAGMPLISDPGHDLVLNCHTLGYKVIPINGACAVVAAAAASGLCELGFTFVGFMPAKSQARQSFLGSMLQHSSAWVGFESPHRIHDFVKDIVAIYPQNCRVMLGRELTKVYETIILTTVGELTAVIDSNWSKGEIVIVVDQVITTDAVIDAQLKAVIADMRLYCSDKSIASWLSKLTKVSKNKLTKYLIESKK